MKRYKKAGIIGCGRISGWNELDSNREKPCTHAGAYKTRNDVEIVGVCDKDVDNAMRFAKFFDIPYYTNKIDELLSKKLDILSICVPYKIHLDIVKKVLNSKFKPKKILLEKPIANNVIHAKKIFELCSKHKVKLYVNNRRLTIFYESLKHLIEKEFDNIILSVSAWCSSGIHTIGIHMIDLLREVCGEVESVFAFNEKEKILKLPFSTNFTNDDPRFTSLIKFKNGINACLFNTAKTDFTYFEIEILCKTGRIRAMDNGHKLIYQKKIKPGKSTLSYRLDKEIEYITKSKNIPLFKRVIDNVLDGEYKTSKIKGFEALKSYEIIDFMKKSSDKNKLQYIK